VVTLAAFMEVLDTTIVNVALPHIAGTLSVSYDEATWALTSYLVSNSIVLPISAFFGRLLGRKRYFVICIGAFTVCSFLCGISANLPQLIIFRGLQGFFGGWITDNYSWRWVFFINVPFGVLATFAVIALVQDPPWAKKAQRASIDYIGIGLIALTFASLQITLDRGEDADWFSSQFIRAFAALAAVGAAGACGWLLYTRKPVVDLRVLKDRNFALGSIAIGCFAMILYGSAILIPQLAQQHLGYTALLSGLVLSPGALAIIFLIPVISLAMPHMQARYFLTVGFLVLGCAMLFSRRLTPDIDFPHLVLLRASQSLGIGFLFVPTSVLAYQTVPHQLRGDATALFTMFRNVAGSIGISLSTAAVTARSQVHMAYLSSHLSQANPNFRQTLAQATAAIKGLGTVAGDAAQAATGQLERTLIAQAGFLAYIDVFLYCAIVAFACVPLTFFFSPVKASGGPGAG
jgi:DHA2 family multidrug resistance protein